MFYIGTNNLTQLIDQFNDLLVANTKNNKLKVKSSFRRFIGTKLLK